MKYSSHWIWIMLSPWYHWYKLYLSCSRVSPWEHRIGVVGVDCVSSSPQSNFKMHDNVINTTNNNNGIKHNTLLLWMSMVSMDNVLFTELLQDWTIWDCKFDCHACIHKFKLGTCCPCPIVHINTVKILVSYILGECMMSIININDVYQRTY